MDDQIPASVAEELARRIHSFFQERWTALGAKQAEATFDKLPAHLRETVLHVARRLIETAGRES